jgi:MFS transporter, DHA1 family, tetracycline resistance protein
MSASRTPALAFIFITMLLDVMGFGLIIPVLPDLLKQMVGGDLGMASRWSGLLLFSYAFMQFLFSPMVGGLSDRYGRRSVILASLFAFGVDFLICGFSLSIGWFFVGRLLAGLTGATFTTGMAYIADISPPDKRAQNFGLVGAAFGLGFVLGPLLGGVISNYYGIRTPFFVAAALAFCNWLYGYFILPESLAPENRRAFSWKRANPLGSVLQIRRYPVILGLVGSFACIYLAGQANQSTWTFINMKKFAWDSMDIGYSLAFVGLAVGLVQGVLSRVLIPKLGERNSVFFGLLMYTFGFLAFAFATQSWMMYAFMVPFSLGGLAGPSLQGIMANQVPANEQGELQGALTSLISLASILGPLLMTGLFSFFTAVDSPIFFPGAPFVMAAALTFLAFILAARRLLK